jgi:CDP-glucose 4,6-dehydratase
VKANSFYSIFNNKKVFITGHTGFKGGWLALWLSHLGAEVYGYSLSSPFAPSLFETLGLENIIHNEVADVRDDKKLLNSISRIQPDVIFHLAAQSLVRESYYSPLQTVQSNVMGTVNVMEAVRVSGISTSMIMVTSDKCYQNKEWVYGYKEEDSLGGHDPYSASKGAAEVLISSWRNSFFHPDKINEHGVRIASVRAGNVVGGGDWSKDRIVPDCVRALMKQQPIEVRNPEATRPWQHVLEPLSGYLLLASRLLQDHKGEYCQAFNFGPAVQSNRSVKDLVEKIIYCWGDGSWMHIDPEIVHHESSLLNLSIDKAYHKLGWSPKWNFDETIARTIEWYKVAQHDPSALRSFTLGQIRLYQALAKSEIKQAEKELIMS